jgi:hypothetical protein
MSLNWLRGFVYTLFGTLVLTTLWVTSLAILSSRPHATEILTQAGTQILNPFLVGHGTGLGLSQQTYAALEASARSHPSEPLTFQVLKVQVLGREIIGQKYADVVHLVYSRVAEAYYDGGGAAVFNVPPQLKQVLPNFALFNPNNLPIIPGGPTPSQLPPFLQPFFSFIGLTPDTFTSTGHQKILTILPWFWVGLLVLGVLAVLLNPSEKKLAGLAQGVVHGSWPVVSVLLFLWLLSLIFAARFAAYVGILGQVSGAFLPIYGAAFVLGLVGIVVTKILQGRNQGAGNTASKNAAGPLATEIAGTRPPANQETNGSSENTAQ